MGCHVRQRERHFQVSVQVLQYCRSRNLFCPAAKSFQAAGFVFPSAAICSFPDVSGMGNWEARPAKQPQPRITQDCSDRNTARMRHPVQQHYRRKEHANNTSRRISSLVADNSSLVARTISISLFPDGSRFSFSGQAG